MNLIRIILPLLLMIVAGCGKEKSPESRSRTREEAEIKNNAKAYEEAYNGKNAEKVASFWAENATYIIPDTGETLNGRSAIADFFKDLFEDEESPKVQVFVDEVTFQGPDKAIEKGRVIFTDNEGQEDKTAYEAQNILEKGKWVLQSVREVEIGNAPASNKNIQELDWLIGSWTDSDEDSDIDLNFKWDANKNFIIERFAVKVLGKEEMEGIQIIGWDPVQQKIRSWVFDSDGGFREGIWLKQGDNWVSNMISTLSDGRKASSVDIYTKVDDHTFNFSMDARDVDGDVLPDIGPVKFTKKNNP